MVGSVVVVEVVVVAVGVGVVAVEVVAACWARSVIEGSLKIGGQRSSESKKEIHFNYLCGSNAINKNSILKKAKAVV